MEKVRKYTWILLCGFLVAYHAYLLILLGGANDLRTTLTASNIALILVFATALLHELKVSKTLLNVMVALSVIACVYTALFSKLWV